MKRILLFILLLTSYAIAYSQDRVVKGVVVDETNQPMPGVSVLVKGTTVGAYTNVDGQYSLKLPLNATTIIYSFMGYTAVEQKVVGKAVLNVKLTPKTVNMKDVVVVGYGSQKKVNMTGAITSVSAKDLLKTPVANMAAALIGRTPGLTTYQKSGQPGADGITLRIRGIGTTNGADPLILVDGVERDFTQLDPNEIESFSILKDAASTAVFGVRGANGVMIVTTKKGEEGPAKVSITSNVSVQQPTRMPKMIGAGDFAKLYNEAQLNDFPSAIPRFSQSDISNYESKLYPLQFPNNDWSAICLKPSAIQQQHNMTISGGTKTTKYYTSVGFFDQEGLMRDLTSQVDNRQLDNNYKYNRFNLRSNIDVDVSPTTKIGVMISGLIKKINDPGYSWSSLISTTPISYPIIYDKKMVSSDLNFAGTPLSTAIGGSLAEKNENTIGLTFTLNQKLDFITKGLLIRGMGSYDSYYAHNISRSQGLVYYKLVTNFPDATGNIVPQFQQVGELTLVTNPTESWGRNRKMHAEGALEYKRGFGGHNIYGLVLATIDKKWYSTSSSDKFYSVPVTYTGVVNRFTYDYKSKYLAEVNLGYNGSENFPANSRFALFPAFSLGWNAAEEDFVKNIVSEDVLDKLKIRGSYGIVGNDANRGIRFMYNDGEYTSGGGAMFGNSTTASQIVNMAGLLEGKLGNPFVTWETATKQNIGLELSMFKNRLTFTGDIFYDDRKDILAPKLSAPTHIAMGGQDAYNIGEVTNRGFELEAKWRHDIGNFTYYVGGNYSFARNKIIELDEIRDLNNPNLWKTGRRIGENFGLIANGFFSSADEIARGPVMGTPGLGDTRYVDVNGDGIVDVKDMTPIGNPEFPEINYGMNMGFGYKGFDFSILFQGATNTSKIMGGKFQKPFDVNGGVMDFVKDERWTPATAATATRPRLTLNYANPTSYLPSTLWLRDGSYLRLRNIEISYRFDKKMIKKYLSLDGVRLYANGQNLITWDKLKVIDPEGDTNDSWNYPQLKVYNVGVKVDF